MLQLQKIFQESTRKVKRCLKTHIQQVSATTNILDHFFGVNHSKYVRRDPPNAYDK